MTNIRLTKSEKSYFLVKDSYSISIELEGDWGEMREVRVQPTDYLNPDQLLFERWVGHLKKEMLA